LWLPPANAGGSLAGKDSAISSSIFFSTRFLSDRLLVAFPGIFSLIFIDKGRLSDACHIRLAETS